MDPRTDAWRGSVQARESLLSQRPPTTRRVALIGLHEPGGQALFLRPGGTGELGLVDHSYVQSSRLAFVAQNVAFYRAGQLVDGAFQRMAGVWVLSTLAAWVDRW